MVTTFPLGLFLMGLVDRLADAVTECFVCREVMFVRRVHFRGVSS